ncbi:putative Insecticidal toxin complex protein TccB2 [Serendipita sp. 399]|nr:putative Insecticidal toxin complex protein TccB2 [Serendipita sp. 399]
MKSKYTSKELYDWMVSQISSTYFTAYNLAYDAAKRAKRSFLFELADTSGTSFISCGYWDSLKSGLLAAESLLYDIKRMESAYIDRNKRELELSKNISLAELDPFALISLRATGQCLVQIPEETYDLDYPGHYLRRIKAVSISIPCIVGPNISVSATLSLTSNRYRAAEDLLSGPNPPYPESPLNGDNRIVYNVGAIQSVALSSAVNDSGVFQLDFRDERYLPFEGTGAIGSWKLQLPTVIRRFDYSTITDVISHIRYTDRDGRSLCQGYNLKQHFSSEWIQFLKTNSTKLTIGPRHLPYFAHSHAPKITEVTWFISSTNNSPQLSFTLDGQTVNLSRDAMFGYLYAGRSADGTVVLRQEFTLSMDPSVVSTLVEMTALVKYELSA